MWHLYIGFCLKSYWLNIPNKDERALSYNHIEQFNVLGKFIMLYKVLVIPNYIY